MLTNTTCSVSSSALTPPNAPNIQRSTARTVPGNGPIAVHWLYSIRRVTRSVHLPSLISCICVFSPELSVLVSFVVDLYVEVSENRPFPITHSGPRPVPQRGA